MRAAFSIILAAHGSSRANTCFATAKSSVIPSLARSQRCLSTANAQFFAASAFTGEPLRNFGRRSVPRSMTTNGCILRTIAELTSKASTPSASATQLITFGGGCFWCVEAGFQRIQGVKKVVSGYEGGHVPNPTYKAVCSETTGHAEVVRVEYDPSEVPFEKLLMVFFTVHDPTQLNRQGNDVGTQYRSCIFYQTEEQKQEIMEFIKNIQPQFSEPIVTQVEKMDVFYPAEDYHQNYYNDNSFQPYCAFVVRPKLAKLEKAGLDK